MAMGFIYLEQYSVTFLYVESQYLDNSNDNCIRNRYRNARFKIIV